MENIIVIPFTIPLTGTQVCIQYDNLIYNNIELYTFFAAPNISLGIYKNV